jgi:hypothetical protein
MAPLEARPGVRPLPFAKACAVLDGSVLHARLEWQAGGYGGSTFAMTATAIV